MFGLYCMLLVVVVVVVAVVVQAARRMSVRPYVLLVSFFSFLFSLFLSFFLF